MATSLRIQPAWIAWLAASSAIYSWSARAEAQEQAPASEQAPAAAEKPAASDATQQASEHYQRGLALYTESEFVLALVEFERAYELSPNFRVLYNIGQVRIQLGRYAKGREALEAYLEQGGSEIPPERVAAVQKDLAMLSQRTAELRITCNEPGADILLDGHSLGSTPVTAPAIVDAGEHTLTVRKLGFYDRSQSLTLAGRDHADLQLDLTKIPEAGPERIVVERHTERVVSKPSHTAMWVGWAATGSLAVTAGVFGYLGAAKANELDSMRTDYGVTRSKLDSTKSSARTLLLVSDITGGAAAVVGGISLYLTLTSPSSERAPPQRAGAARRPIALGISPHGLKLVASF